MSNLIHRALAAEKKLFILLAVAALAVGCNQNPPSVGETGTVTPVDDSTHQTEPVTTGNINISATRTDSLTYIFSFTTDIITSATDVRWDIKEPDGTLANHLQQSRPLNYTFHSPGRAEVKVTLYNDGNTGPLVPAASKKISVNVY